jgi:hypothetical protein
VFFETGFILISLISLSVNFHKKGTRHFETSVLLYSPVQCRHMIYLKLTTF